MSARETKGDEHGYKRGEKGFANSKDDGQFTGKNYKKELLETEKPVGRLATIGDGRHGTQEGY